MGLVQNYRNDDRLREQFHLFIGVVFPGADFRRWHEMGFWNDSYVPYSIVESGKIVSNVSAALMDIFVNGKMMKAVQIGAVGTLPEHRGRGLSRQLMDYVLDVYKNIGIIFLFANETVLDFYPRFGFRRINESIFIRRTDLSAHGFSAEKLDIENEKDLKLLLRLMKNRLPLTRRFGAEKCGYISMWHVLNIYSDNVYYLADRDVAVIITEKEGTLNLLDVVFCGEFDLEEALPSIVSSSVSEVRFYFPPDILCYKYDEIITEDTGLFIRGEAELGPEPFRFIPTAVT